MNNINKADDIRSNLSHQEDEDEEIEKPFYIWGSWSQNITTPLKLDFTQPAIITKIA